MTPATPWQPLGRGAHVATMQATHYRENADQRRNLANPEQLPAAAEPLLAEQLAVFAAPADPARRACGRPNRLYEKRARNYLGLVKLAFLELYLRLRTKPARAALS